MARSGHYTINDLPLIWEKQLKAENIARASGASFVVCDTGPEVIKIWEEVKFGISSPIVNKGFQERQYDLTLLCFPDIPWVPDPLREAPEARARKDLLMRYKSLLMGREYFKIQGKGRLAQAIILVDRLVNSLR